VLDSRKPYGFRLEQLYAPSLALTQSPSARVALWQRRGAGPPQKLKDLTTVDAIGRDLRETPCWFDVDLHGLADGVYLLQVEVFDGERSIGMAPLSIALCQGLDETIAGLETAAQAAPDSLRADILFPVDRIRSVNRGLLELRTFDVQHALAAAKEVADAARAGHDPFAGRTGDLKRHYLLEAANEIMPFRVYVPRTYTGGQPFPLILALHGLGGTEDALFDGYGKRLPALAEERGYIVAAPLGYRIDGGYGWGLGTPPADAANRRHQERSERDVMEVLARVQKLYRIDPSRIYLMGHSMGAIGTWKFAAKYPRLWAAVAPFAGTGVPATLEVARHIPELVVHGDADRTVDVRGSRAMVNKLKELGTDVVYVEVPGGGHSDVVAPNFSRMFDFFDAHAGAPR
jgi:poly(3-hydroxybutyrate) depolymerase